VLSRQFPEMTEENHETLQAGYPVFQNSKRALPQYKSRTYRYANPIGLSIP
jgi:hypothetical protein